jgi:hypothetical protein
MRHLWQWLSRRPRGGRTFRPALERLEERAVCTVTYHGGPVLRHVEVEVLFVGSNWASDTALSGPQQQVVNFLQTITNSTFMDMLTRAGYGVGRGSYLDSWTDPLGLPGIVTDAQLQGELSAAIAGGHLQAPDANRLYFVIPEPGVEVVRADGSNSLKDFWGYHSDFLGPTRLNVSYAVVPYLDGSTGVIPGLAPFETMTKITAHELAEGVTDPFGDNVGVGAWYDPHWHGAGAGQSGGEIGDIADNTIVDLGGYVVQGVANRHDRPIIPAGAVRDPRFFHPRPVHAAHHPHHRPARHH